MFSAVTGSTVGTSGRAQMPPMVRVGRAQWRSHGATGQAGNGRPRLIKKFDAVITALFYLQGQPPPTANPATDPPTSRPTYPRDREVPLACLVGEPCARVRYPRRRCVVGVFGMLFEASEPRDFMLLQIRTPPMFHRFRLRNHRRRPLQLIKSRRILFAGA